jgi:hypothetical protein
MDASSILDTVQALSLVVAAWTAIYGLNAWRSEFLGKKRIDLAEDVLVRFYEARDVIRVIRNPFGFVGEGRSRQAGENEGPDEKRILDNAYVVFERYESHRELFNQLGSLKYRFTAQFGADAARPFDELSGIVNEVFISARMLSYYWKDQGRRQWRTDEQFQRHLTEMRKQEQVFWETGQGDEISKRVNDVVNEDRRDLQP